MDGSFEGTNATRVILPRNVHTICSRAFADMPNLETIIMYDGITFIEDDAFDGTNIKTIVYVTDDYYRNTYVLNWAETHNIWFYSLFTGNG